MRETLNPASGPVLAAAALIVSPALWHGLVGGGLSLDVALSRYLVAVVGCWLALGVFLALMPDSAPRRGDDEADVDPDRGDDTRVLAPIPAEATDLGTPDPYAS